MTDPTEPRPAVAEVEVEAAAEAMWQAEAVRAHGRRRAADWVDQGSAERRKWCGLAHAGLEAARGAEVARLQRALATAESAVVTACNMRAAAEARASKAVDVVTPWLKADHIRLHAGEMTAQEMRSVLAVVGAIHRQIAALLNTEATTTQTGGGDE